MECSPIKRARSLKSRPVGAALLTLLLTAGCGGTQQAQTPEPIPDTVVQEVETFAVEVTDDGRLVLIDAAFDAPYFALVPGQWP
ncbi:MAG: hypothetical protein ACJAYU_004155, partial [Bradymonadia bacterium]